MNPDENNQKIATARAEFLNALRATFDSPAGKSILAWLHSAAATRRPSFKIGEKDPDAPIWRDGRKSIVWEIEANLETARASYGATPDTGKPKATRTRATRGKSG